MRQRVGEYEVCIMPQLGLWERWNDGYTGKQAELFLFPRRTVSVLVGLQWLTAVC